MPGLGIAIAALSGIVVTVVGGQVLYALNRPRKKLRLDTAYCADLFTTSGAIFSDAIEIMDAGGGIFDPAVITYSLESIGNQVITDCSILIRANGSARIRRARIGAADVQKCDRIRDCCHSEQELRFKLSRLNPGDYMSITLLADNSTEIDDFEFMAEAEGMEFVKHCFVLDCDWGFECTPCEDLPAANDADAVD